MKQYQAVVAFLLGIGMGAVQVASAQSTSDMFWRGLAERTVRALEKTADNTAKSAEATRALQASIERMRH